MKSEAKLEAVKLEEAVKVEEPTENPGTAVPASEVVPDDGSYSHEPPEFKEQEKIDVTGERRVLVKVKGTTPNNEIRYGLCFIREFKTVDDIVKHLKEAQIVELINKAVRIEDMNAYRNLYLRGVTLSASQKAELEKKRRAEELIKEWQETDHSKMVESKNIPELLELAGLIPPADQAELFTLLSQRKQK